MKGTPFRKRYAITAGLFIAASILQGLDERKIGNPVTGGIAMLFFIWGVFVPGWLAKEEAVEKWGKEAVETLTNFGMKALIVGFLGYLGVRGVITGCDLIKRFTIEGFIIGILASLFALASIWGAVYIGCTPKSDWDKQRDSD